MVATQWKTRCVQCGQEVHVADQIRVRDARRGRSWPQICGTCSQHEKEELRSVPAPSVELGLTPQVEGPKAAGPHYRQEEIESRLDRDAFSVTDEEIAALYRELQRPDTPVVIAVAPTGSGKSTFLPYRLLEPEGQTREAFTNGKQIVITQPRRDATVNIAKYVAGTLHGAEVGAGQEIGYRVRGDENLDPRNRLVYVTDGTLINWIVQGRLDDVSMVIIDEAHERSLNIDVVLGLLAESLIEYPHLKVLIVSATIDHQRFRRHFDDCLPGHLRCGIVECSGSKPVGLSVHWRRPELGTLDYQPGTLDRLGKEVWEDLGDAIVRIVLAMHRPSGDDPPLEPGDVLGFLHGQDPITRACEHIKNQLQRLAPGVAEITDVYPLYANLDAKARQRAIGPKKDPTRRRVVIASNAAETSLTVDSLVHVVDSGFIKQTQWDEIQGTAPLRPIAHSQAGCRQRWGRVGRTSEGFAWCLYSAEQFSGVLPADTVPEIQRSQLDEVVLKALRGGAHDLGDRFPWLDPPNRANLGHAIERLRRKGLIDGDLDLTEIGIEASTGGEADASLAAMLDAADQFGFGVEMATIIPMVEEGLDAVMPLDRELGSAERRNLLGLRDRLIGDADDDLEATLRIFDTWRYSTELDADESWQPPKLSSAAKDKINDAGMTASEIQELIASARRVEDIRRSLPGGLRDLPGIEKHEGVLLRKIRKTACERYGLDASVLEDIDRRRSRLLRQLGGGKKKLEDRAFDYAGLPRLRAVLGASAPDEILIATSEAGTGKLTYTFLTSDDSELPVGIDRASALSRNQPQRFLTVGPRQVITPRNGETERRLMSRFGIRLDGLDLEELLGKDTARLAIWLSEQFPRPIAAEEARRRTEQSAFLRSRFPIGALVECLARDEATDGGWVDVIGPATWPFAPVKDLKPARSRVERREHERERSVSFDPLSVATDGPDDVAAGEAAMNSDEDTGLDDIEELAEVEESGELEETGETGPVLAPEPSRSQESPDIPVSGRLSVRSHMPPATRVTAEVVGYEELGPTPTLLLAAPTMDERFRSFSETYRPGDRVTVEIIADASQTGRNELRVRERVTGFTCSIDNSQLSSTGVSGVVEMYRTGSLLQLTVDRIDRHTKDVAYTAADVLDEVLPELLAGGRSRATVTHLSASPRDIFVDAVVACETTLDGGTALFHAPLTFRVSRRGLEDSGKLRMPYEPGQEVSVVARRTSRPGEVKIPGRPGDTASLMLESAGLRMAKGKLIADSPISASDRAHLIRELGEDYRDAINYLFWESNRLDGDAVISDLESRYPKGSWVKLRVTHAYRDGVKGIIDEQGTQGQVSPGEVSWHSKKPQVREHAQEGDVLDAVVLGVSGGSQLDLSLKQTAPDPWENGAAGIRQRYGRSRFTATVRRSTSITDSAVFAQIEPSLDGRIHVSELRKLRRGRGFIEHPRDVVRVGDLLEVQVKMIHERDRKIDLALVKRLWNDPELSGAPSSTQPETDKGAETTERIGWLDGPWPWTPGENALPAGHQATPPSPSPPPPPGWQRRSDILRDYWMR